MQFADSENLLPPKVRFGRNFGLQVIQHRGAAWFPEENPLEI